MRHVSVGWKDQLAALKHVFPQFPTDTRHIWQRPHADFKFKSRVKNNPTQLIRVRVKLSQALSRNLTLTLINGLRSTSNSIRQTFDPTQTNGANNNCKSSLLNLVPNAASLPNTPSANAALRACSSMMRSSMLPSTTIL